MWIDRQKRPATNRTGTMDDSGEKSVDGSSIRGTRHGNNYVTRAPIEDIWPIIKAIVSREKLTRTPDLSPMPLNDDVRAVVIIVKRSRDKRCRYSGRWSRAV